MKLLIAIPALNEEGAIGAIIERSLSAVPSIIGSSPVTEVEIAVVSDGSTDRTVEIARSYGNKIKLFVLEKNQGYGAAILTAWKDSDADLLSFLDADGSCEPSMFGTLCAALDETGADVALGCRMHKHSKMPRLRWVGNRIFATMLSLFSARRLRDVASGMRVVRRTSLPKLMPLPTGLHFTPAMSARAALGPNLSVVERDMPYNERVGRSKLKPFRDGMRFFRIITEMAMLYRPSRPMGVIANTFLLLAILMMIGPTRFYLREHYVQEWMIYRFLVSHLLGVGAVLLFCTGYLGRKTALLALTDDPRDQLHPGFWGLLFATHYFWILPAFLTLLGTALVSHALHDFVTTGKVYEHWSRFIPMTFCLSVAMIFSVTKILDHSLNMIADRLAYLRGLSDDVLSREPGKAVPAWLRVVGATHGAMAHDRRVRVLAHQVAKLIPGHASVIDIGCGDGKIAKLILNQRSDITIEGYDVLARDKSAITVHSFDGEHLPLPDQSVDVAILVDVLHHTTDPLVLLREAKRVARRAIIIKDHRMSRPDARFVLRFMDWVGNRPHGVELPYNYWPMSKWENAWKTLGLRVEHQQTYLGLYSVWAGWFFEPGLHFLVRLAVKPTETK